MHGNRYPSFLYIIATVLISIFVTEGLETFIPISVPSSSYLDVFLNSLLHTAMVFPLLYFFFVRRMKQISKDLELAEGQLSLQVAALESAANGILITDGKGDIIWANKAFASLTGYSSDDVIGRNTRILKSDKHDASLYVGLWETIMTGQVWHGEMINKRKDGTFYFEEMTITPVFNEVGEITNFVSIKQDVSERKKMEDDLREINQLLIALVDSSPVAIVCLNRDGKIITWNIAAEEIFGWKEHEVLGLPLPLVPEEMTEEFDGLYRKVLSGKVLKNLELSSRRKDSVSIDVNLTAAPMYSGTGEIIGVIGLLTDIARQKQMAAALKKAEEERLKNRNIEALGRLAVGVAHEINNPLSNASLNLEILKGKLIDIAAEPGLVKRVEAIESNIGRASVIAKEMLQFAHQRPYDFNRLNVNNLISNAISHIGYKLNDIVIHKNTRDVPDIYGDSMKLEQVIINILNNAVEAIPNGGDIRIESSYSDGRVVIDIKDTGVGIPEEEITKVFEPFFTTKEVGGTGLGLSICHGIIKQHDGRIKIESAVNKGTRVTLKLPPAEDHEKNSDSR